MKIKEKIGLTGVMKLQMQTKEEFFQFEKEKQKIFNEFYQENNWPYKRIFGKENKKYDCVILIDKRWIKIEEKFRSKDWPDFLVEIIQDTKTNSPGWIYYTQADWILYGIGKKIYRVEVQKLREFLKFYENELDVKISEKGWGTTENLVIPWSVVIINSIGKIVKEGL